MHLTKEVINSVVILQECVTLLASQRTRAGSGERVFYRSQFGLQENNEDPRFYKCCVTQRWNSLTTFELNELPEVRHKDPASDLHSAKSINTITAPKLKEGFGIVIQINLDCEMEGIMLEEYILHAEGVCCVCGCIFWHHKRGSMNVPVQLRGIEAVCCQWEWVTVNGDDSLSL